MAVNQSDLDSFHDFASQTLARLSGDQSLEDLLKLWRAKQEHTETVASVRRGVEDADAGRLLDLEHVDAKVRSELGLPARNR